MSKNRNKLTSRGGSVDRFLETVARMPDVHRPRGRGRLLFALDATLSRQPTWDRACAIQADMFEATADIGGLSVQMVYFRGHGEFHRSEWVNDPRALSREMTGVQCRGGLTQIEKVLKHAIAEGKAGRVDALVYVGDCAEEDADRLCALAGELGLMGIPAFVFQEGGDRAAGRVFPEIARLTNGAHCRFDSASPGQLRDLLKAVALYASGGRKALENQAKSSASARYLIEQMK